MPPHQKSELENGRIVLTKIRDYMRQSFKVRRTPLGVASLYHKYFQSYWPKLALEFTSDGSLIYTRIKNQPSILIFQLVEVAVLILYGCMICPYVIFKSLTITQSEKGYYLYSQIDWVTRGMHVVAMISSVMSL